MALSPEETHEKDGREAKDEPLKVPEKEVAGDAFPAEKDVSKPPAGTDQSESTSPPGRPRKS
jgi:hypothetical protein